MEQNKQNAQVIRCRNCGKPTYLWNDHFCVTEYYVSNEKVFPEPYWKTLARRLTKKLWR